MRTLKVQSSAEKFIPEDRNLEHLQAAAVSCRGCELWKNATQTVFGAGREQATLMLVGEQPGDQEDLQGRPFCGPAGRILDKGLTEAGIRHEEAYITNAVKHFKWIERGKRRIHAKPNAREIAACRPWLVAEVEAIRPRVLICLGTTAARSVLGKAVKISEWRGTLLDSELGSRVAVTVHPSSILRIKDQEMRRVAMQHFIEDLRKARACLSAPKT